MGIEPTQDASAAPANGFEDRGFASTDVHRCPLQFDRTPSASRTVRLCPLVSSKLGVYLAVVGELLIAPGLRLQRSAARGLSPEVRVSGPRLRVQSASSCSTS
jgi:hypothetical protein